MPKLRTIAAIVALGMLAAWIGAPLVQAESMHLVPPPALDETPKQATSETAVLAGGCFWGVQGVFQHVDGVLSAVSGYAGGAKDTAQYEQVGTGRTGHAESVRIVYDPSKVSYGQLLQIYFSVAHDPTELNRQGPDIGSQYRSTIFPTSEEQTGVARAYIDQLNQAARLRRQGRHHHRARPQLLSGRGLPSGLSDLAPQAALHCDVRPAQARGPEEAVPQPLSRHSRPGRPDRDIGVRPDWAAARGAGRARARRGRAATARCGPAPDDGSGG